MKILHILDERWDSGLTAYGLSAASALSVAGHDVWVAALPGKPAEAEARRRGLPVLPLGAWGLRSFVGREKFGVVNAHTGRGHTLGAWAVWGRPIALVRTRGEARQVSRRVGHGWVYRRTGAVIAASQNIADQQAAVFPETESRLHVIYPGLDLGAAAPPPSGPLRFAVVGRLDPVKGHGVFLEAIALVKDRLGDARFVVAGEEKNISVRELLSLAARRGIADRVEFLGRLPDVRAFMAGCHAGVISSVGSEALSRVCLEWMAAGRPVLSTTVGGLPELVRPGETGQLVPPNNPRALADALVKWVQSLESLRVMGQKARQAAETRFTLPRLALETEEAYKKALG